jgi:ssDNA-binding replication factor A large subunit
MFDDLDTVTKESIYEKLKDLLSPEEFEKQLRELREEHQGLLNDEALAFLILDEMGQNDFQKNTVSELRDGDYVTLKLEVVSTPTVRTIKTRDGGEKELAEIRASDDTGALTLTLWHSELIAMVREELVKKGMLVKVINGRFKRSRYGEQVNMGYYSKLEIPGVD